MRQPRSVRAASEQRRLSESKARGENSVCPTRHFYIRTTAECGGGRGKIREVGHRLWQLTAKILTWGVRIWICSTLNWKSPSVKQRSSHSATEIVLDTRPKQRLLITGLRRPIPLRPLCAIPQRASGSGANMPHGVDTHRCFGSHLAEFMVLTAMAIVLHDIELVLHPLGYFAAERKIKGLPPPHPRGSFRFRVLGRCQLVGGPERAEKVHSARSRTLHRTLRLHVAFVPPEPAPGSPWPAGILYAAGHEGAGVETGGRQGHAAHLLPRVACRRN